MPINRRFSARGLRRWEVWRVVGPGPGTVIGLTADSVEVEKFCSWNVAAAHDLRRTGVLDRRIDSSKLLADVGRWGSASVS